MTTVRYRLGQLRGRRDIRACLQVWADKMAEAGGFLAENGLTAIQPRVIDGDTVEFRFVREVDAVHFALRFDAEVVAL